MSALITPKLLKKQFEQEEKKMAPEKKPKLVSITMAWDDGSSLTYAPSGWDSIDKLIIEMMLEAAGVKGEVQPS